MYSKESILISNSNVTNIHILFTLIPWFQEGILYELSSLCDPGPYKWPEVIIQYCQINFIVYKYPRIYLKLYCYKYSDILYKTSSYIGTNYPLDFILDPVNDLETSKWHPKWNPCPQKHYKCGITHDSSENRSWSILLTFIGGGHFEFRAIKPLKGSYNLLAIVFENLVSIHITMQKFENWSQSAR
jgi:hypothetical protein